MVAIHGMFSNLKEEFDRWVAQTGTCIMLLLEACSVRT